jgi:hypothetical protein
MLDYRAFPPGAPHRVSRMAVASLASALLACPGLPLLVIASGSRWLDPRYSDVPAILLLALLAWGIVGGRVAWLATHAADEPLRGRAVAALALTLNTLWLLLFLAALAVVAWIERHGFR